MLDLSSGAMQEVEEGPGQGDPQVIKLLVQIGDVNVRWAGTYSDVLTLHFTAY